MNEAADILIDETIGDEGEVRSGSPSRLPVGKRKRSVLN
jgi:hypothetical protein